MSQTQIQRLKPSQAIFIKTALSPSIIEILYAGPANTGKTYTTAVLNVGLANDFPETRIGVFRKDQANAMKTVWHTYQKVLLEYGIPHKPVRSSDNPRFIIYTRNDKGELKTSTIEFFGLDKSKDPDWNKLKSLELSIVHIEEANEVDTSARGILSTRIGRWNANGVPAKMIYTCNPAQGWVKTDFRDPAMEGKLEKPKAFVESNESEMPEDYKVMLHSTLTPEEYSRYVQNNWEFSTDPNQLIPYEYVKRNTISSTNLVANKLSVDVAREGNDRTVIGHLHKADFLKTYIKSEVYTKQDTITTAIAVQNRMKELTIGYEAVNIDLPGVGGGVVDYLRLQGLNVNAINTGESPTNTDVGYLQFRNLRAQIMWEVRSGFETNTLQIVDDPELVKEITNVRYYVKDKQIQIESKLDIKKRLGYSPDKGDALGLAVYDPPLNEARMYFA